MKINFCWDNEEARLDYIQDRMQRIGELYFQAQEDPFYQRIANFAVYYTFMELQGEKVLIDLYDKAV